MPASRRGRGGGLWQRATCTPMSAAPSRAVILLAGLLVALAAGRTAAHGSGLGFVPTIQPATTRRRAVAARRRGVITASSVQEPPPSVPRFGSGEEEEGGSSGGGSGAAAGRGLGAVLSSLAKQRRFPIPGTPFVQEQQPEREPVLASTPQPFSLETAVLLAPFAFEAYNDPPRTEGWWQLGADQNEVAIMSQPFLQEAYGGVLRVRVLGLTETRPGTGPVLASKKKAISPASMLPPLPLPVDSAKTEADGNVVEATVTLELGDDFLGTQRLQLNRSTTQGGRFTYTPTEEEGAFAAFIKDPLQPQQTQQQQQPQPQQLLRLTLKGEDQAPLGSAWLDLAEVVKGPPAVQSEAADTWRWELSLSQPTPPPLAAAAASAEDGDGSSDSGSEARQRLAEVALGVRVEVDLQYVRLDASGPVPAPLRPQGPPQQQQALPAQEAAVEEWKGATGCSRDWRELAKALGGDAVAAADTDLLCFLENKETDAQVKLWRDSKRKRLIVAYRGTEVWKWRDLVVDLKLLQEPWDVRALHRGEDMASAPTSTMEEAPVSAVEEEADGAADGAGAVDIYTALAAQANRTMLMYNDLDSAMKEVPGWIGGYVGQMLRAFGSSSSTGSAGLTDLPPSLLMAEAAAAARHHHQLQEQAAAAAAQGKDGPRARPPVALTAPGLDPTDAREPRALSPIRPSPTAYPSAAAWAAEAVAATAPSQEESGAVADVFIAALDKVVKGLGMAGGGVTSFVQPLTGRVRSVADFQRAFAEVARALGLASQLAAAATATATAAAGETTTEAAAAAAIAAAVSEAAGAGESPLVLLPSRFRSTFASLVEETLRFMDAREQQAAPTPTPKPVASFTSSLLQQADFSARLSQALEQVVLPGLQRRQLQLGLNATVATAAAAVAETAAAVATAAMPALDAEAFGNSEEARVHAGFKEAYLSVRPRLLELISSAAGGRVEEDGWEILCTGHSMGGALASLQAHDLSVLYPRNRVRMYNFGSPRIGNSAFAREYERANGDSYRIVNEWDVIARFPRGLNTSIFNYDHAGKTALLNFAPANSTLWVEGEQEGPCPLRDMQPLKPAPQAADASSSVELEPLFLEAEWQLLNALMNGAGFTSHLEYRYFESLNAAQRHLAQRAGEAVAAAESEQIQQQLKPWPAAKEAGLLAPSSSAAGPATPGQSQSLGSWFRVPMPNPLDIVTAATTGGGAK